MKDMNMMFSTGKGTFTKNRASTLRDCLHVETDITKRIFTIQYTVKVLVYK